MRVRDDLVDTRYTREGDLNSGAACKRNIISVGTKFSVDDVLGPLCCQIWDATAIFL